MVYTIKILFNIGFEIPIILSKKILCFLYCFMGAFVFAGCIGIINEYFLIDRLQNINYGMMNDSISEIGNCYCSFFGNINFEISIITRLISFINKFSLQLY